MMSNFERLDLPHAAVMVYGYFKAFTDVNDCKANIPVYLDMKACCNSTGIKAVTQVHAGLHLLMLHDIIVKARDRNYFLNPVYFDKVKQ